LVITSLRSAVCTRTVSVPFDLRRRDGEHVLVGLFRGRIRGVSGELHRVRHHLFDLVMERVELLVGELAPLD